MDLYSIADGNGVCNAARLIGKSLLFFNVDDHIDYVFLVSSIVMCFLLFVITLPCKFGFKDVVSRLLFL